MTKNNIKDIQKLESIAINLLNSGNVTHGLGRSLRGLLGEIAVYKNHINSLPRLKSYLNTQSYKNVQVGGGKHFLKGFINIDIVPPADIIFDVREGLPLKTNSTDFIFSEHFLEHIDYPLSVNKFISECYRILKKEGKLVIGVPDSQLIISAYVKKDKKLWEQMIKKWYSNRNCLEHFNTYIDLVNYHFRDQDDDFKYHPHFWAYDFEKLKSLLTSVGFIKVKKWKFNKAIANPKRKWGSLYVEALK